VITALQALRLPMLTADADAVLARRRSSQRFLTKEPLRALPRVSAERPQQPVEGAERA